MGVGNGSEWVGPYAEQLQKWGFDPGLRTIPAKGEFPESRKHEEHEGNEGHEEEQKHEKRIERIARIRTDRLWRRTNQRVLLNRSDELDSRSEGSVLIRSIR
jgi:hypothetical protein